ncbi:hypothetical protein N5B55_04995 [Ralstonia pickettii]|uniref:hypothetical protein n=1 Tax=Ralstonia pickettii TaxID=329 RepID=UPI0027151091|nr:hypothetical protein [Ralstonia pickettii]WKZ86311.1 hypothetical protein N5B55_04995 [Ralstonia pickettii]
MEMTITLLAYLLAGCAIAAVAWGIAKTVDGALWVQDKLTRMWLRRMPARLRALNR